MGRDTRVSRSHLERTAWFVLSTVVAVALLGCAGPVTQRVAVDASSRGQEEELQRRLAYKTLFDLDARLYRVGYSVLKGAVSECGSNVRPSLGFRALSNQDVSGENRALIADALNLTSQRKVLTVYRNGAAEAAGLKLGDVLVSSSAGQPVANETREAALARMPPGRPVTLQIMRDGATMTLTMTPDQVCDYPLKVTNGGEVNAYADGKMIYISRGMMRFASEDRELAMVVGHELGHNTMGHLDKKKTNAAIGAVFDILAAAYRVNTQSAFMNAGASAYSQDFESEADYVGMYYMARAGYETIGAADFWRRMAAEHPGNIKANHAASHPASAERFLALDKVGGEVRAKMASGVALAPNRIGGPTTGQPPAQTVQAAGAPQGAAVPTLVPAPVSITATPAPSRVVQVPAPATASPSPPPAPAPVGQDSYVAERLARESSCSANPTASLVAKGAGFESFSVRCASGDALMIRCEFGNCRVLK